MQFFGVFQYESDYDEYSYFVNAYENEEDANQWVETQAQAEIATFAKWREKYPDAYGPSLEQQTNRINGRYEVRLVEGIID